MFTEKENTLMAFQQCQVKVGKDAYFDPYCLLMIVL